MATVLPSSENKEDSTQTAKMPSLDVVSTAHYESGPPASKCKPSLEDPDVIEVVKEEAWEEKKIKTTKKTKNIERRVQRQLVLEDGEVREDSGPVVTEDCTEDTVTNEVVSNENQKPQGQIEAAESPGEGWVAVPGSVEISEKCTKTVNSHEEVEDELETEEIQHCGDVTNKEAEDHVVGKSDLRSLVEHRKSHGLEIALPQKRIVHEATRKRGNVDTVDVKETSRLQDGYVVTETEKTVCKEEYDNESAPDSGSSISDGSAHETKKETSHNLVHTKDEDLLEYYAVPRGGTLAQGVKIGEGMHVVSEDVHEDRQGGEVESLNEKYKREPKKPFKSSEAFRERTDALTRKPLDYQQEEKTRKSETNRWLETHFGSESGRSGSSSIDGSNEGRHSAGGNRITITMSPRPATPEDVADTPITPIRRSHDKPSSFGIKIPPPPPPKPERNWSSSISPTSPPPHQPPRDIQKSELTAARARLRFTGLNLTEDNKENSHPSDSPSPPHSPFNGDVTPYGRRVNSINVTTYNKEPVYSSRFSSGRPEMKFQSNERKSYVNSQKGCYSRRSPSHSPSPPPRSPSPPPQQISTSPPPPLSSSNVGRSHSFHISTLPWFSKKKSESKHTRTSTLKDYKSEERLDHADKKPFSNTRRKLFEKFSNITNKEPTPPPPPRQPRRNYSSIHSIAEASTQTSPTPVPPPRTKRKKRHPTTQYFFGQEEPVISRYSSSITNSHMVNGYDDRNSYSSYSNGTRNNRKSYEYKSSPKIEKRYRTTKTITPIVVMPLQDTERDRYRNSDVPRSSWTNTVDPRRRPRSYYEDDKPTTLPRKLYSDYSSPRRQYFFGENDSSSDSYSNRRAHSYNRNDRHEKYIERNPTPLYNTLPVERTSKNVGRSQSFNVQAGSSNYSNLRDRPHLSNISGQKTSTVYRSSPYLNLRSPNLIANITRTPSMGKASSVDNLDAPAEPKSEESKNRFMEGLLNTAPELFHFIHGEEDKSHNSRVADKSNLNSPKIYTFGKPDSGSTGRLNSEERYIPNHDEHHQNEYSQNSLNRKTAFNLKTSGRSMLYSPAFRQRINSDERYHSRNSLNGERLDREYSSRSMHAK